YNPLVVGNVSGEHVQQRGFSGAGSARDNDVQACPDRTLQQLQHGLGQGLIGHQILLRDRNVSEAADGEMWTVYCEGRNDCVYTGTVRQACIDHGGRFVDAASHVGDNLLNDVHQMSVVFEPYVRLFQNPSTFHV